MLRNPFRPTFGASPPLLVGREDPIAAWAESLESGPGHPGRAVLISGGRGTGKTVLLNELETVAQERGWLVVSETCHAGILGRLVDTRLPELLAAHDPEAVQRSMRGVSLGPVGARMDATQRYQPKPDLRAQLTRLTDVLAGAARHTDAPGGVVVSIDETNPSAAEEIAQVCQAIQHMFREQRQVGLLLAGLPQDVDQLLSATGVTFIRRAERVWLGEVDPQAAAQGIEAPFHAAGRAMADDALRLATESTHGYPFMIQLVGYGTWRAAGEAREVTRDHVAQGIAYAEERVGSLVIAPELAPLATGSRDFLEAMAVDDGPSRTGVLAERLGKDQGYVSQYRRRLIDAGLVRPAGYGRLDFVNPWTRGFLRLQAGTEPFPST